MTTYAETLATLEEQHLRRRLRTFASADQHHRVRDVDGNVFISFSSNDYLGLAHHPRLKEAAQAALARHGVGSGASRLISGDHPCHRQLEDALADFKQTEAALTFATGFATAAGFASAFLDRSSIVLLDKLCHASLIDACRASAATIRVFRHHDMEKLASLLAWARKRSTHGDVYILTESVFSMDGDVTPLEEIVNLKERYGAKVLLDEAHAVGVLGPEGRGLAAAHGLTDRVDFHMGTLGKAIGVSGGYLAGSAAMVDMLINRARSFIYSTAPPPALAEAARASLAIVRGAEGDERRERVRARMRQLVEALAQPLPPAAILPLILGKEEDALAKAASLERAGFHVPAIRYPTVARGQARLRIAVSAAHSAEEIDSLTGALSAQ